MPDPIKYNPITDLEHPVIWAYPNSVEDRRAGGICAETGFWAPGHCMVIVEGKKVIAEFAYEPRKD